MQIEPQNTIPLIYQITDPSDSTIYYIRAVVYDSLTREVLSTQNLVSRGSGLWTSTALAPVDSTGLGRHIHVIIKVYTDSGYTTLSDSYNQQIDKYLVKSANRFGGGSGGNGQDINYDKIGKLVETIVQNKLDTIKQKPVDQSNIITLLNKISSAINAIKVPEQTPTDLAPIIKDINDIKVIVDKIASEEIEKPVDYSDILKGIDVSLKQYSLGLQTIQDATTDIKSSIEGPKQIVDELKKVSDLATMLKSNIEEKGNKIKEIANSFISEINNVSTGEQHKQPENKELSKYFNA